MNAEDSEDCVTFEAAEGGNLWHVTVMVDGEHAGQLLMSPRQYEVWCRTMGFG